jgi:transcriptional regulator with PAS, ATPase and Fis domain
MVVEKKIVPFSDLCEIKHNIIGESKVIKTAIRQAKKVAKSDASVLILGDSGTGKELVAKLIHDASQRKFKPFVAINCTALAPELIASELFGHEKGSFSSAYKKKIGHIERADGGTVFLDEIGDLGLGLQTQLLRFLQEGEIQRVGGEKIIKVDVRVISATNIYMQQAVREKKFREDLFYRLNVVSLVLLPLNRRREDIPHLVNHFLEKYSIDNKKNEISAIAAGELYGRDWRGNVRELENVVQRAIIMKEGDRIEITDLEELPKDRKLENKKSPGLKENTTLSRESHVLREIIANDFNMTRTAKVLKIQRTYLSRVFAEIKRKYNIEFTSILPTEEQKQTVINLKNRLQRKYDRYNL